MPKAITLPFALLAILLSSCDSRSTNSLAPQVSALQRQVREQSGQIALLRFQIEMLQQKTAVIDPTSTGYVTVETPQGKLLISCDGAEPYLDGHRIKLRIGNPNMVTYSGFTLTVKWGPKSPELPDRSTDPEAASHWRVEYDKWKQSLKQRDINFVQELKPGAWNSVEFVLSPTKPSDLGHIDVTIATNTISLYRDATD